MDLKSILREELDKVKKIADKKQKDINSLMTQLNELRLEMGNAVDPIKKCDDLIESNILMDKCQNLIKEQAELISNLELLLKIIKDRSTLEEKNEYLNILLKKFIDNEEYIKCSVIKKSLE